jgi:hypothetical protein
MRIARGLLIALASLGLITSSAQAQIPTATGRSFTLTDTAWKLFIPDGYIPRATPVADVLVHLHGDPQTVWNNTKYAQLNTIVLTANYGALSSAYQTPFTNNPNLLSNVLSEALTKVRQQSDFADTLQWDKLGVSSFSAGYAGLREILKNATYYSEIDGIVMEDSLYASYTSATDLTPLDSQMANFRSFALAAKNGIKRFTMTHSQVATSGYCNTVATADDMLAYLGMSATPTSSTGVGGITYYRTASSGNFKMYGATGSGAADHSKHLQYSGQWLSAMPLAQVPEPVIAPLLISVAVLARRRSR